MYGSPPSLPARDARSLGSAELFSLVTIVICFVCVGNDLANDICCHSFIDDFSTEPPPLLLDVSANGCALGSFTVVPYEELMSLLVILQIFNLVGTGYVLVLLAQRSSI